MGLPRPVLFLLSSTIHAGCCEEAGLGGNFGESGLLSALSSQLDFVGLQRLGSIVLEGLTGRDASSGNPVFWNGGGLLDDGVLGRLSNADSSPPCREAGRDDGREADLLVPGVVVVVVGSRINMLCGLARVLSTEPRCVLVFSGRVNAGGLATDHRFTLSLLFIIALCTNPPMPLVGEVVRAGEERPVGVKATGSA